MLEIFLLAGCLASGMNQQACDKSWSVYHDQNQDMLLIEKNFNHQYVDPLPGEVKYLGGSVYTLYHKEIVFPVYHGVIVDLRDRGQGGLAIKMDFP